MAMFFKEKTKWDILATSKKGDTFHKNISVPTDVFDITTSPSPPIAYDLCISDAWYVDAKE